MKAKELRDWIDSLTDDIEFEYNGIWGSICPFSRKCISLCYDENEVTVNSVDAAMNEPFINGRTLNEISEKLKI